MFRYYKLGVIERLISEVSTYQDKEDDVQYCNQRQEASFRLHLQKGEKLTFYRHTKLCTHYHTYRFWPREAVD